MFQLTSDKLGLGRKSPLCEKLGLQSSRRSRHWYLTYLICRNLHPKCQFSEVHLPPHARHNSQPCALLFTAVAPRKTFRFPLSQARLGCVEHQGIDTFWRWQQHAHLLILPVSGSPAVDWRLPRIWREAKILDPFLSCCLLEQTLFGRGRKGTCTGAPMEEPLALYLPSSSSPERLAWSQGLLTPKRGWLYRPVPALHPIQTGN